MRQNVRRLFGGAHEDPDDAVGHLLLAADRARQQHRWSFEHLVLDVHHLVDQLELALHRLVHRRNHLPRRQVRDLAEHGLQPLQHQTHRNQRCSAQDLVDENVNVSLWRLDLLAQERRLWPHELLALVAQFAHNPARAVGHGLEKQCALRRAVPLLLRCRPAQGVPIGQDRLELVFRRKVAHKRGQQTTELVAELHKACFRTHALDEHALLRFAGVIDDKQFLNLIGLDLARIQDGQDLLPGLVDFHKFPVAFVQ
mmetsp:Transcript_79794/g.243984  ORF Transcript_79794/g.243984 Transcript_79794/m.243984 type:complete len:255 (-) Transcript_79794:2753-3517(-)